MNTTNLKGRRKKYVKVYSSDPVKKVVYLYIMANIKPYIRIRPEQVVLRGMSGEIKTAEVFITGNLEAPLKIEAASFSLDGKIDYKIDMIEEGRKYKVKFENIPNIMGSYRGYLELKTNYRKRPRIKIRVSSRFRSVNNEQ